MEEARQSLHTCATQTLASADKIDLQKPMEHRNCCPLGNFCDTNAEFNKCVNKCIKEPPFEGEAAFGESVFVYPSGAQRLKSALPRTTTPLGAVEILYPDSNPYPAATFSGVACGLLAAVSVVSGCRR